MTAPWSHDPAPIIVHRISDDGGRRVTAHVRCLDQILGTAYSGVDLIEFLRRVGVAEPARRRHE